MKWMTLFIHLYLQCFIIMMVCFNCQYGILVCLFHELWNERVCNGMKEAILGFRSPKHRQLKRAREPRGRTPNQKACLCNKWFSFIDLLYDVFDRENLKTRFFFIFIYYKNKIMNLIYFSVFDLQPFSLTDLYS